MFLFAFPVILLFIFGSEFDGDIAPGVTFTQCFAAGTVAAGVMVSSFQSLAISIAVERDDGTPTRVRGTPMPPPAYFLGKIGLVLVTSLVQTDGPEVVAQRSKRGVRMVAGSLGAG